MNLVLETKYGIHLHVFPARLSGKTSVVSHNANIPLGQMCQILALTEDMLSRDLTVMELKDRIEVEVKPLFPGVQRFRVYGWVCWSDYERSRQGSQESLADFRNGEEAA